MFKFRMAIFKELIVLWNDKTGLSLMFILPLILVTVVTLVQDSAFELANKNRITMLVANRDEGETGKKLLGLLEQSGMFRIIEKNDIEKESLSDALKAENALSGLYIPPDFSARMRQRTSDVSQRVLHDFGLAEKPPGKMREMASIDLYFDPVLRENFTMTITNILNAYLAELENTLMISLLYEDMGAGQKSQDIYAMMRNNRTVINRYTASGGEAPLAVNATQHNVPAWTIFAIFFMVISLGGNMVREKVNGSFVRIRTMPTSIMMLMNSKILVYLVITVLQVAIIFSFSALIFPFLRLPPLEIPNNPVAFAVVLLTTGMAAVSYAFAIGAFAKTQVQANGFGAISVIIFAALGGIWVPVFLMPDYLQDISWFSPLRQSLDSFYILFLKGGNWPELSKPVAALWVFILTCMGITYFKFKADKLL